MLQAKRWSSCQPASAIRVTAAFASDSATPRATSLRASSERECSRRTSSESARCAGVGSGRGRLGARGLPGSVLVVRLIVLLAGGLRHELLAQHAFDPVGDRGVLLEELAGVLLALSDTLLVAAVPGAGLLDHAGVHAHLDQLALALDALAIEDLGDDLLQRRR